MVIGGVLAQMQMQNNGSAAAVSARGSDPVEGARWNGEDLAATCASHDKAEISFQALAHLRADAGGGASRQPSLSPASKPASPASDSRRSGITGGPRAMGTDPGPGFDLGRSYSINNGIVMNPNGTVSTGSLF